MKKSLFSVALAGLFLLCNIPGLHAQDKNLSFDFTVNQTTYTSSANAAKTFKPGNTINAYTYKFLQSVPDNFKDQEVIYFYEIATADLTIFKHVFTKICKSTSFVSVNLIPDPESNEDIVFRRDWTGGFLRALMKLPQAVHLLKMTVFIEFEGTQVKIAYGEINYDNTGEVTADLKKMADAIDENASYDPYKELSDWIDQNGGWDAWKAKADADLQQSDAEDAKREEKDYYKVNIKNDCGDSKTFVVNDNQTYTVDGKSLTTVTLRRGTSGKLMLNGSLLKTLTEGMEGQSFTICP